MIKISNNKGFTLVEMMVVVAVLGILISLTAFGFRGWQEGIAQREVKSDLNMLAAAMESEKNFGSGYSTSLPSTFKASDGITIDYIGGNESSYCIEARSSAFSSVVFNIIAGTAGAQSGGCDVAYALGAPMPTVSSITKTSFTVSWAAIAGSTTYSVKYGTSTPTTQASCTSSPCTISGLSINTQYRVQVTASSAYDTTDSAVVTTRTANYTCDSGDTLSGTTCTDTYPATYVAGTSPTYSCPSGGTLSGTTCTYSATYNQCPSGWSYTSAANKCDKYLGSTSAGGAPSECSTLYPSTNFVAGGDTSLRVPWRCYNRIDPSPYYSCPSGGTLSGTSCTYAATSSGGTSGYYTCPSGGTPSGTTCTRTYPAY
jgi:prepilin-type N-terminal cleavage/methylation domain-containing protein